MLEPTSFATVYFWMQESGMNDYDELRHIYSSHANAESPYDRWERNTKGFKLHIGFQIFHFPLEKLLIAWSRMAVITFDYPKHATLIS